MPSKLFFTTILALLLLQCGTREEVPPKTWTIQNLKLHAQKAQVSEEKVRVKGLYVDQPVPMLLTNMLWPRVNSKMPDSVYLLLDVPKDNSEPADMPAYGSLVEIEGRCYQNVSGSNKELSIKVDHVRAMKSAAAQTKVYRPGRMEFQDFTDSVTAIPQLIRSQNCALLYSGGFDRAGAHIRFWNNLVFMYKTLVNVYGYSPKNIVVVYRAGTPETYGPGSIPVHFAAHPEGLQDAIQTLKSRLTGENDLLLYVTNHGGGLHRSIGPFGGRPDSIAPDEIDPGRFDESIDYYDFPAPLYDDHFAAMIGCLNFNKLIAVLQPCFSGGLLHDLRGPHRVLMSACKEDDLSYEHPTVPFDIFSYYVISALAKRDHRGNPVNADTDGDGRVSMLEAFEHARIIGAELDYLRLERREEPLLEDNGDGIGVFRPNARFGDGVLANSAFL